MKTDKILGTQNLSTEFPQTPSMSDEEIQKALNIPPRDIENYPEIPKETQLKAGSFLYKLNLLASGADGNLQSLVWELYDKMDDYLHLDKPKASLELASTLEALKDYLQKNNNIIFSEISSYTPETKKD